MIVLDTCILIWLSTDPAALSPAALEAMSGTEDLAIAGITLYELAWLVSHRRIRIALTLEQFLARLSKRFTVLPITAEIARVASELPPSYPNDPTDRLIGATALAHGAALVTRDRAIRSSGAVPVIW